MFWQPASHSVPPIAATTDGGAPVAARPAPAHPPKPVLAPGACGKAMASIRRIQRAYPSGAVLPESANAQLTADLGCLDDVCASMRALQQEFRDRLGNLRLAPMPPSGPLAGLPAGMWGGMTCRQPRCSG